ncbi:MAG: hypothetical protein RJQ09_16690 [Cyclobacteriaceae bacterium]
MKERHTTNAMNEWGCIGQESWWVLATPPQVLNLNQGVAMSETRG